ncbi:glutaminyl-peptide cyclotransferase [Psychroserpens sp.]|uniref:glutaminyl-peptide cyclotransferase n=1 Tax=Psychroserpens sp. TaxID=2020870 RepID=UPI001B05D542|nr:glutaminyl-peptide cyclotransferase [Psychroserpens sp.]MBO6606756.1 glutaminyl-peptide cyclotransferase [Psychroserpens sp.]MBO6653459.1 glutaminyl-peptide cyclotransferase [Psychroserpens sp.]MBO6680513.1 glutaminyl-peptide cyclotransferase [Psychroserpens sp.]MBO6750528.1 glutaminyl-peptide cyclotransferase [Psychroserpens sp.]MBO6915011.1 glutaminyl-peptide cyclotransferase [Psychroserpens sp.]
MRLFNAFLITVLSLTFYACGNSSSQKSQLTISTSAEKNVATLGDQINLKLNNPRNLEITKVDYFMDGKAISETVNLSDVTLGIHNITAQVSFDETSEELSTKVTVLNNMTPKVYSYKIVNTYPHDINSYTQGLEFHNGELYESTGQYGTSKLRKVDYKTGEVLQNIDLAQQYFGEGLTIFDNKILQLTWRENIGFIYDVNSFERISSFTYSKSPEGWGICNDGTNIYKSDGTENIWLLNPETLEEMSKIQVYTNKGKIIGLNELEYINGRIYSNRYQKNGVAIINPENGGIEGVIDFTPLRKLVTQHDQLDVLNGIAYNPETGTIFVTGKLWDKLFEVEVFEK